LPLAQFNSDRIEKFPIPLGKELGAPFAATLLAARYGFGGRIQQQGFVAKGNGWRSRCTQGSRLELILTPSRLTHGNHFKE
jgi:hypothetical protein